MVRRSSLGGSTSASDSGLAHVEGRDVELRVPEDHPSLSTAFHFLKEEHQNPQKQRIRKAIVSVSGKIVEDGPVFVPTGFSIVLKQSMDAYQKPEITWPESCLSGGLMCCLGYVEQRVVEREEEVKITGAAKRRASREARQQQPSGFMALKQSDVEKVKPLKQSSPPTTEAPASRRGSVSSIGSRRGSVDRRDVMSVNIEIISMKLIVLAGGVDGHVLLAYGKGVKVKLMGVDLEFGRRNSWAIEGKKGGGAGGQSKLGAAALKVRFLRAKAELLIARK